MIYVIVNDWVPDINISFKKTQIFFEIDFSIHFPSYENNIVKTPFPSDVHIILTNSTGINSISRANPIVIDATCLEILKSDLFTFSTRFRFFFFSTTIPPKITQLGKPLGVELLIGGLVVQESSGRWKGHEESCA